MTVDEWLEMYTIDDMGVDRADRPPLVEFGRTYITSPYFRSLYYSRGYYDGLVGFPQRDDKGLHPDNIEAYEMGWEDGFGDTTFGL